MKKVFAGLVCIILLTLCVSSGLAVKAQYANTIAFLDAMDVLGINYTVEGIAESNDEMEHVKMNNQGEKASYTIHYFFAKDNSEVNIRIWDLITFRDADLAKVLRTVNTLNESYKYINWSVDESDNTVSVSWDLILRENPDTAMILTEATIHVVRCIDTGYETIEIYNQ